MPHNEVVPITQPERRALLMQLNKGVFDNAPALVLQIHRYEAKLRDVEDALEDAVKNALNDD